jgi:predicted GNAT family N-acyltransferase
MNNLTIKQVKYTEEITAIQTIRRQVFQQEQGVSPELEFDGQDDEAIHLLAYISDRAVGTTRIRFINLTTAKIERLAVLPLARGQGIGKKLMESASAIVEQNNGEKIIVHAQAYIKELYKTLGFEQVGDEFAEAGIPHVKMIKIIRKSKLN